MATLYVKLVIFSMYPTCTSVRSWLEVGAIIFVRRSLGVLMLLRALDLRFPTLDTLGSGRGVSLDWFLVTVRALSVFLRLVAGFT